MIVVTAVVFIHLLPKPLATSDVRSTFLRQ